MTTQDALPKVAELASKDFYWGILPREEMRQFVSAAERLGFEQARKTFKFSGRFDYAESFERADFHFFLPIPETGRILDLGSGFGNITIPLSFWYKHITAADASRELLDISRVRARDLGRANISFVHIDPIGSSPLPFADNSFDAILLNGVFEWVGLSDNSSDPSAIQKFLLAELKRILRPDGIVYIGIENRWFPGWFKRDPHSKLPYTVFLPRFVAHWYARKHGLNNGYRTYIYGYSAYRKMFFEFFNNVQILIPHTSYRDPKIIYPLCKEAVSYFFYTGFGSKVYTRRWYFFLKLGRYIGVVHKFVSSYMFILNSGKDDSDISLCHRLLKEAYPQHFKETDTIIKIGSDNEYMIVCAIRKNASSPYAKYAIPRLGGTRGSNRITFTPELGENSHH